MARDKRAGIFNGTIGEYRNNLAEFARRFFEQQPAVPPAIPPAGEITRSRYTHFEFDLDGDGAFVPMTVNREQAVGGLDLGGPDYTVEMRIEPLPNPNPGSADLLHLMERVQQEIERVYSVPTRVFGINEIDLSEIRPRGEPLSLNGRRLDFKQLVPDAEAEKRAMDLLLANLSKEQRECYEARGYFVVKGEMTGRTYHITNRKVMNIYVINELGFVVKGLCVIPEGNLPLGDVLLSQKLGLELYEIDTLAQARVFYDMNAGYPARRLSSYWPWQSDAT